MWTSAFPLRRLGRASVVLLAVVACACTASPPPATGDGAPTPPAPGGMEEAAAASSGEGEAAPSEEPVAVEAAEVDAELDAAAENEAPAAGEAEGDEARPAFEAAQLEPPEWSEWQVDDEGRRYFIDRVAKLEGWYTRMEDDIVRVRNLMPIKVDHEDDEYFYHRVYDVSDVEKAPPRGPSAETLAELEAIFVAVELPQVDRLEAVPFETGLPVYGQWRNGFDVADMNGDGHLDVVHGPARKGVPEPNVFLGDAAGNWRPWQAQYPPLRYDYGDAAVADFDGDGRPDVALAMHLTGIAVLLQEADGVFRRDGEAPALIGEQAAGEAVFTSRTLAVADWNQDGAPDLLALAEGPVRPQLAGDQGQGATSFGSLVLLNDGEGWRPLSADGADEGFGQEMAAADFDGDGQLDFVTASSLLGYNQMLKITGEDGTWRSTAIEEIRPRSLIWSLAVDDFDADGRPDVALTYFSSRWGQVHEGIDVLYNRFAEGGGWQREALAVHAVESILDGTYPRYTALGTGDLDGDGRRDLAALTADGATHLFLGRAEGGFAFERSPELAAEGQPQFRCQGYHVRLVDLDGDGRDEIVAGFAGESGSEQLAGGISGGAACRSQGALRAWKLHPAT